MVDVYNPANLQPLAVFFDITLGSYSKIYVGPEIPVDFTLTLGDASEILLTLYDLDGSVEHAIYESRDPETGTPGGTFQWGYLNGKKSQVYNFQISGYRPVFMGNAYMIVIKGTTLMSPFVSSNSYSGTIMEVLNKFVENHKMTLNVVPPFGTQHMQEVGKTDVDSTAESETIHMKDADMSDAAFLDQVLKWALDEEGKGGYNWKISDDGSGKAVLNITKAANGSGDFKYVVQDKESVVIAFRPEVNFDGVVKDQNDAEQNSIQRFTGMEHKLVGQQSLTKDKQETFGLPVSPQIKASPPKPDAKDFQQFGTGNMGPDVTGASTRSRPASSTSSGAGVNAFLNSHLWQWMSSYEASLEILGDPDVVPTLTQGSTALCDVTCYWPTNYRQKQSKQLHYTSGLYQIVSVTHHVSAGSYITTLSLSRAAANTPEGAESDGG